MNLENMRTVLLIGKPIISSILGVVGLGVRVLGLGVRVSGLGVRVLGLGLEF